MSRPSRMVFVGNIPWDATDESMAELFQEAGPLISFRLVTDKETLKPKGYGFAEYHDIETAKSAVRNLNDLDLGGRKLRVDFAESEAAAKSLGLELPRPPVTSAPASLPTTGGQTPILVRPSSITPPLTQQPAVGISAPPSTSSTPTPPITTLPPAALPQGPNATPFQPAQSATDAISAVIGGMTKEKLTEVLTNVKLLSSTQPDQVRALLSGNPQLTYCLMQMMLVCGLVDPTAIQNIVKTVTAPPPPPAPVVPTPPPPTYAPLVSAPQVDPRLAAPPIALPITQPTPVGPPSYNTVPIANTLAAMTVQQRQLLMQVFSLSPAHIEALPPEQKATVLQLRAQFPQFPNLPQPPI